ncbi:bifunctional pyr operon transcriptional regulator/uracil phosphoribosyltransferase PyrR [bacterium]|nr:bifunctional pyr operon transcriptional regulator/uracil phosphoribosyltransferase PyrR [bacterium]
MNSPSRDRLVLDAKMIERTLKRMADEIVEQNQGTESLLVVGIQTRGVNLAERLVQCIQQAEEVRVPTGKLDITLYRDDLRHVAVQPLVRSTDLPSDITGLHVVLVDDVLFTGRTVRSALDALVDFGRPARIQLAVLVDRGHRELPIQADIVGKTVASAQNEEVVVKVREVDGADGVWIRPV